MTTIVNGNGVDKVLAGAVTRDKLPAGTVLQVVSGTSTTTTSTTSSSFVSTGLTATITPTSSTNKIVAYVLGGEIDTSSPGTNAVQGTIYRNNSVNLGNSAGMFTDFSASGRIQAGVSCGVVDLPSTTSATTYTFYIRESFGTATVSYNAVGSVATLILMEIAA